MKKSIKKDPILLRQCDPLQYKRLIEISFLKEDLVFLHNALEAASANFDECGNYSNMIKAEDWQKRVASIYNYGK